MRKVTFKRTLSLALAAAMAASVCTTALADNVVVDTEPAAVSQNESVEDDQVDESIEIEEPEKEEAEESEQTLAEEDPEVEGTEEGETKEVPGEPETEETEQDPEEVENDSEEQVQDKTETETEVDGEEQTVDETENTSEDQTPAEPEELVASTEQNEAVVLEAEQTEKVAKVGDNEYTTLAEAIQNANDGAEIKLEKDVVMDATLTVNKNVTITSTEGSTFTISASDNFSGSMLLEITANVTLGNIKLDANKKCRVIYCKQGKVTVDGATITGGKGKYVGGVYMTNLSWFEMKSGEITGNESTGNEDEYTKYAADLWIGANANGELSAINGGTIGNIFVNANEYSASNQGAFTISGGSATNVYVEYGNGYGAQFTFNGGSIENLYVSTTNGNGDCTTYTNPAFGNYKGGVQQVAQVGNTAYATIDEAAAAAANGDTIVLLKDAETSKLMLQKDITLDLGGNTLSGSGYVLDVYNKVTIQNGTVELKESGSSTIWVNTTAQLVIAENAELKTINNCYAIAYDPSCTSASVTVNGKISGEGNGITVQGLIKTPGNTLNLDGANINVEGHGLYLAGEAVTTLSGTPSVINGTTGIEIRSGELNILNKSTISGKGEFVCAPNGNGATTDGAALAIAQHTTKLNIKVTIADGIFKSDSKAVNESNPQKNDPAPKVDLSITGGSFNGEIALADVNKCISGGLFTQKVNANYIVEGKACNDNDDATYKYVIGDPIELPDMENTVADPTVEATVSAEIPEDLKETAKEQAEKIAVNDTASKEQIKNDIDDSVQIDTETVKIAEQKLMAAPSINYDPATDTLRIVTEPTLKVEATGMESGKSIAFDITLNYVVKATKEKAGTALNESNSVELSSGVITDLSKEIVIDLGDVTAVELPGSANVFVKHTHNGAVNYYDAETTLTADGSKIATAKFKTKGFSPFVLMADPSATVTIDGTSAAIISLANSQNVALSSLLQANVPSGYHLTGWKYVDANGVEQIIADVLTRESLESLMTAANGGTLTVTPIFAENASSGSSSSGSGYVAPDDSVYYTCVKCGYHDWTATADGYQCDHCGYKEVVKQIAGYEHVKGVYEPVSTQQANAKALSVSTTGSPKNGDSTNLALAVSALAVSLAGVGALVFLRKKNH